MQDKIHLPMVNLTPTMRCNLKCELCGVLVPHYEYRPHMALKEFEETLKAVFELAETVDKLQITGGEPLLHPDLPKMLEVCFQYSSQFKVLWLFTNCAVPVQPKLLEVLQQHKDRVLIHVSDYGVRSDVTEELLQKLEEHQIPYRYQKYFGEDQYAGGWVDQGDFVKHGRTQAELEEVFSKCTHVTRGGSWYIRGGQAHWCGRSIRGMEVGKIPQCEEDYVDIFSGTVEERRAKMSRLMQARQILACDYCNGYYGTEDQEKRCPAGGQVGSC